MALSEFNKSNLLRLFPCTSDITVASDNSLSVAHLNIRSIVNKIDFIINSNLILFDILIFTETFLTQDVPDSLLHIDGFKFYRKDRLGDKSGGGIIFYYKAHISASLLSDLDLNDAESLWVKIPDFKSNSSTIISSIYRLPNKSWKLFCDSLIDVIDKVNQKENLLCIGDFNINLLDSYPTNYLKSSLGALDLFVLKKLPTRITD